MKIKIGVMSYETYKQRTIDIATGKRKPGRDEPKIWFNSMRSLSEVLSDNNRLLLKIIAQKKPETMQELADLSGRKLSNLSRTLKTFEAYGFIETIKSGRTKKPIAKATAFDVSIT